MNSAHLILQSLNIFQCLFMYSVLRCHSMHHTILRKGFIRVSFNLQLFHFSQPYCFVITKLSEAVTWMLLGSNQGSSLWPSKSQSEVNVCINHTTIYCEGFNNKWWYNSVTLVEAWKIAPLQSYNGFKYVKRLKKNESDV